MFLKLLRKTRLLKCIKGLVSENPLAVNVLIPAEKCPQKIAPNKPSLLENSLQGIKLPFRKFRLYFRPNITWWTIRPQNLEEFQWTFWYCNDVGVTSPLILPLHCWYIVNETHDDVNLRYQPDIRILRLDQSEFWCRLDIFVITDAIQQKKILHELVPLQYQPQ